MEVNVKMSDVEGTPRGGECGMALGVHTHLDTHRQGHTGHRDIAAT